jgi:hypothetical protein
MRKVCGACAEEAMSYCRKLDQPVDKNSTQAIVCEHYHSKQMKMTDFKFLDLEKEVN